jgi:uncharacterized repeat protein (TIGR03803 family)
MKNTEPGPHPATAFAAVALVLLLVTPAWSRSTENVLYRFTGGDDGRYPSSNLALDKAGNLYGTTYSGGFTGCIDSGDGCGLVFELSPGSNGSWTETVLYTFQGSTDGGYPLGVAIDGAGNLYGTTEVGGNLACGQGAGCGTVFELSPGSGGAWTEIVLHTFEAGNDGDAPFAGVIFDRSGNLYGTTYAGGSNDSGTVFELSPNSNGTWTETVLYSFNDEGNPWAGVTVDHAGNLYGTTEAGCVNAQVYKLTESGGAWLESRIGYGYCMLAGVVLDKKGNVYGTDYCSGPADDDCGNGAVLILAKAGSTYKEDYMAIQSLEDGMAPQASVLLDPAGNLYGTTSLGGRGTCFGGCGVLFEFTHSQKGWEEKVLHNFGSRPDDGQEPVAPVIRDRAGNLYGTAAYGGTGFGVVYEVNR